jgi:hypothetical protein
LGSLCFLFLSVGSADHIHLLQGLPVAQAASTYYVSPSGSSSSCTKTSPCSLTTGLDKAQAGDEVVLLNGTYTQMLQSKRSGAEGRPITIRAETRHQAVFRISIGNLTQFDHSYLTIRGIKFDGQRSGGPNGAIRLIKGVHHIIFEDNQVLDMATSCLHFPTSEPDKKIHHIIIRHNLIDGCGYRDYWGEAVYTGAKGSDRHVVHDIEIYGNTFRDFTENGIDTHLGVDNLVVHHNIFEGQVTWIDRGGSAVIYNNRVRGTANHSTIMAGTGLNTGNRVYSNIMKNNKGGFGLFLLTTQSAKVTNNVGFGNVGGLNDLVKVAQVANASTPKTEFAYNTFCNLPTYNIQSRELYNINDNRINAPQSECDKEVARIKNEMQQLPGAPGYPPSPSQPVLPPPYLRVIVGSIR